MISNEIEDRILLPLYNNRKYRNKLIRNHKYHYSTKRACFKDIKDKTILEIGSNTGFDAFLLSKKNKAIDLLDGDGELLDISKKIAKENKINNVSFIHSSFENYLTNTSKKYDVIYSFHTIKLFELEKYLPIILNRCNVFIWGHGNIQYSNGKVYKEWDKKELYEVINKFNYKKIKISSNYLGLLFYNQVYTYGFISFQSH